MLTSLLAQAVALDRKYPVATSITGVASGLFGWLSAQLHAIAQFITDVGLVAAGITSVLVLVVKVASMLADWRERGTIVPRHHDEDES